MPLRPNTTRPYLVLSVCSLALLVNGLDATIVNVALPTIRRTLHASVAQLQWTVDGYTLVLGCLLVLAGSVADRVGRKRTFLAGLVVFAVGSLLCALAPSIGVLVAARVLQGVGGSMLSPVPMSIIRTVFDDPGERARAIGIYAGMFGLSIALGPVLGGVLVDTLGWRSIFFVNLPVIALAVVMAVRVVPESRADRPRRPDPVGQLLVVVVLGALTYAVIEAPGHGWGSASTSTLLVVTVLALALLVAYERRRREPLIEPRAFRSVPFSAAMVMVVCAFAAFGGFLFLTALHLQRTRGFSPLAAGTALLPLALAVLVCAPLAGRLVGAVGPRAPLLLGGAALVVGLTILSMVDARTPLPWLLGAYAAFGAGIGLVNPPINNTAMLGLPPERAGVAAALTATGRQVGFTLGVALVGAIPTVGPAWWTLAGAGAVVLLLGALSTSRRLMPTAASSPA